MTIHWSNACKAASPDWHVIKTPYMSAVIINLKINSTNNIKNIFAVHLEEKFFQVIFFNYYLIRYANNLRGFLDLWNSLSHWFWRCGPLDLLHQYHLGTHEKCKFFSSIPALLNQKLWWWGPGNCVLTNPLGDSDAS